MTEEGDHARLPEPPHEGPEDERLAGPSAPAPVDKTVEQPPTTGPSGTAILPSVPPAEPPGGTPWAGRAAVPTPAREELPREETYAEPPLQQPRSLTMPVLLAATVVLLLAVLAFGVWLIVVNRPGPVPPVPPISTSTSSTSASVSASPRAVQIPTVAGDNYEAAATKLRLLHLVPERRDEPSAADAGTVLRTDPPEGSTVDPGTHVTVIVSLGPQPTPTTTAPTAPPTTVGPTHS